MLTEISRESISALKHLSSIVIKLGWITKSATCSLGPDNCLDETS